jgi:hypothetical protein
VANPPLKSALPQVKAAIRDSKMPDTFTDIRVSRTRHLHPERWNPMDNLAALNVILAENPILKRLPGVKYNHL